MLKQSSDHEGLPQLPIKDNRFAGKTVFVAKQRQENLFGEELEYTQPSKHPIPLSVKLNKTKGPQKRDDGRLVEFSVLGDADEFEEMERKLNGITKEDEQPLDEQRELASNTIQTERAQEELDQRLKVAQQKQIEERKRWLNRLFIFQRYREVREEHALRNWRRHSRQWSRIERSLTKRSHKDPSELLMARLGEYREKVEERDLIYEAFRLLEDQKVNFWSKGLRIGNDLLGLMVTAPRGGIRRYSDYVVHIKAVPDIRIERMVTNESKHYKAPPKSAYRTVRKKELENVISKLDPFFPPNTGGYLEVTGRSLNSAELQNFAETYADRLDDKLKSAPSKEPQIEASEAAVAVGFQKPEQMGSLPPLQTDLSAEIVFAATHMSFEVLLNEVSRSVLSVYNQSDVAYHFEWRKVMKSSALKVRAMNDNVQRFYFYHKKGVLLPGTVFDFPMNFKSCSPGIYSETWELVTNPKITETVSTKVTFQGFALEQDTNKDKRHSIEKMLETGSAKTTALEVIDDILNMIKFSDNQLSAVDKRNLVLSNDDTLFTALNADLHLAFDSKLFEQFRALYATVTTALQECPTIWDRSVRTIYEKLLLINDFDMRSISLHKLNELVKLSCSTPATSTFSVLYMIGYDVIVDLADKIAECSESKRILLGLPLVRSCTKFEKPEEDGEDIGDLNARKTTPGTVDVKKGTQPAKDSKAKPAPPAKAPPPSKGKKDSGLDESTLRPPLTKIIKKPQKPSSATEWSRERKKAEAQYNIEFRLDVRKLVQSSIARICELFGDISEYRFDIPSSSETEIRATVEAARSISKALTSGPTKEPVAPAVDNENSIKNEPTTSAIHTGSDTEPTIQTDILSKPAKAAADAKRKATSPNKDKK